MEDGTVVVEAIVALTAGGVLAYVLAGSATRSAGPATRGGRGASTAAPASPPPAAPPSAPAIAPPSMVPAAPGPRKATQTAGKFRD